MALVDHIVKKSPDKKEEPKYSEKEIYLLRALLNLLLYVGKSGGGTHDNKNLFWISPETQTMLPNNIRVNMG